MKALITGIGGFSGRHLTVLLEKENVTVTGIDRSKNKYHQADLTDKKQLQAVLTEEKPDFIFHLASPLIRSDQLIDQSLVDNLKVDLFGTVNLIEAAASLKTKPRILITGTNAQYKTSQKPISEDYQLKPLTGYGLSKLTQELIGKTLADSYGLEIITTRTFHLIGPGQSPGFVVTDFCRQIAMMEVGKAEAELKVGNPDIRRDFTDVRDAVSAYWLLMQNGKNGETYNVCSGQGYSLKEIIEKLKSLSKIDFEVISLDNRLRQNDPDSITGDNQKLKSLGWQPQYSLDSSLKDTLDYWRSQTN
ncbi:MAG TPA: GDP-mannose 4,6-dehydratase [Patescibacteria group bacterium]|nr:GDP-mannose 4,6-dehydratase [Patescibacteria group bacterium]